MLHANIYSYEQYKNQLIEYEKHITKLIVHKMTTKEISQIYKDCGECQFEIDICKDFIFLEDEALNAFLNFIK